MNFLKKNLHAILLPVILASAALFAAFHRTETGEVRGRSALNRFPAVEPEKVRAIRVTGGGKTLNVESRDGLWILPESENACASRAAVTTFLTQLARTKPLREVESSDEDTLKNLNLSTDPSLPLGFGGGIKVELFDEKGARLSTFILGKAHIRREAGALTAPERNTYDGRYVRIDTADAGPRVFLISRVFDQCMPSPGYWLEQLQIPTAGTGILRVHYTRVENDKKTLVWCVLPDMRKRSFLLLYPQGRTLELQDLAKRLESIAAPFSREIIPAEQAKSLAFTEEFTVFLGNGASYSLQMARMDDKSAAAKLSIDLQDGKLPRAEGESDADYDLRKKQLAFQIQYTKTAFENRVFRVKPELIELLAPVPATPLPGGAK